MDTNKNMQVIVSKDASAPSRFMAEVKPSDGTPKSRRQVRSQIEVTRFASEHGVDKMRIEWNGLLDLLPEHQPQAATAQK